ncbi:hypothetical protein LCGC14_1486600 [marine sediment metagenome]|uniref:Uncharacterized protein n=1 Tax=marine sediment metagenome TaxID=412755 RepID=A0A0F9LNP4_9ZZZZ
MPRPIKPELARQRVRVMEATAEKGGTYTLAAQELVRLGDNITSTALKWWAKRNPKFVLPSLYDSLMARTPGQRAQMSQRMKEQQATGKTKPRQRKAGKVRVTKPEPQPSAGWLPQCTNCGEVVSQTPEEVFKGLVDYITSLREQIGTQSVLISSMRKENTDLQAKVLNMEHLKVELREEKEKADIKAKKQLEKALA